jgi:L-histidine Nalpha-methyltransferase
MEIIKSIDSTFAEDVVKGLSSNPKHIPSKYLYDEKGDRLFKAIMRIPEYYLTNSELEILKIYKEEILNAFTSTSEEFLLVDLGAGDGLKTKILLDLLIKKNIRFHYLPVDFSPTALEKLCSELSYSMPGLKVKGIADDYYKAILKLSKEKTKKIYMILGSNIGNMQEQEINEFLSFLGQNMENQDKLFIGFDLKKDPDILLKAYDDSQGLTRSFNFNLLERLNYELGGNFNIKDFKHFPTYDPQTGEMRSYLISKKKQTIALAALDITIEFKQWEFIHVETSKKFDIASIKKLAEGNKFKINYIFNDSRNYFLNTIWSLNH